MKALVRWSTGKRLTNRLPKLRLITLLHENDTSIRGLQTVIQRLCRTGSRGVAAAPMIPLADDRYTTAKKQAAPAASVASKMNHAPSLPSPIKQNEDNARVSVHVYVCIRPHVLKEGAGGCWEDTKRERRQLQCIRVHEHTRADPWHSGGIDIA